MFHLYIICAHTTLNLQAQAEDAAFLDALVPRQRAVEEAEGGEGGTQGTTQVATQRGDQGGTRGAGRIDEAVWLLSQEPSSQLMSQTQTQTQRPGSGRSQPGSGAGGSGAGGGEGKGVESWAKRQTGEENEGDADDSEWPATQPPSRGGGQRVGSPSSAVGSGRQGGAAPSQGGRGVPVWGTREAPGVSTTGRALQYNTGVRWH